MRRSPVLERAGGEGFGLICPLFADETTGREAFKCLETTVDVVGSARRDGHIGSASRWRP